MSDRGMQGGFRVAAAVCILGLCPLSVLADETEEIAQLTSASATNAAPAASQGTKPAAAAAPVLPVRVVESRLPGAVSNILVSSTLIDELGTARMELYQLRSEVARLQSELQRVNVNAHYNMGCVYRACGQFRRAEMEFQEALKLNPDDPDTHYNLGVMYDESLGNRVKAREHYQRFVELAPQDPDAAKVQEWLLSLKP